MPLPFSLATEAAAATEAAGATAAKQIIPVLAQALWGMSHL